MAPIHRVGERVDLPEPAINSLPPGFAISHYRIERLIATGGMGLVYKAVDVNLGRRVALKILSDASSDPVSLERFRGEARTLSALEHPNICTVYEFGEHLGRPFMAMQLLDGETLKDHLAREGRLDISVLIRAAIDIANALDAAHRQGIIHRDIKPSNLFLARSGHAVIVDFGIATLDVRREGMESGIIAASSISSGTREYMSPEQLQGRTVDARTDIFSFGLVLYEMATGRHAFDRETLTGGADWDWNQAAVEPSRYNPMLPRELEQVILRAVAIDPEKRFSSAADLRDAIAGEPSRANSRSTVVAGPPVSSKPERPQFRFVGPLNRRTVWISLVALMAALSLIVWVWKKRADRTWAQASVSRVEQLTAAGRTKKVMTWRSGFSRISRRSQR